MKVMEIVLSTSIPEQRRHLAVLLAGALRPPESGAVDQIPEDGEQRGRDHHDDDLLQRHRDAEHRIDLADQRRDRLVAWALGDLDEIGKCDRHADRGDQRRQSEGASERPVGDLLDGPVVEAGEQHGDDHHDQQRHHDRDRVEHPKQKQERDQGRECANHEDVAMREVDHPDNAVDHRITDGDQTIDRAQREPIDKLLDEILHTEVAPQEAAIARLHSFFCYSPSPRASSLDCNVIPLATHHPR